MKTFKFDTVECKTTVTVQDNAKVELVNGEITITYPNQSSDINIEIPAEYFEDENEKRRLKELEDDYDDEDAELRRQAEEE